MTAPVPLAFIRTLRKMISTLRAVLRLSGVYPVRSIAAKLGMLSGAIVLVLVVTFALLLVQSEQTAREYDRIFSEQVRQSQDVRKLQLEFKRQVQEWNILLLRGSDPAELATLVADFRHQDYLVNSLSNELIGRATDSKVHNDLVQFRTDHEELHAAYENALAGFVAGGGKDFAAADQLVGGRDEAPTAILEAIVEYISGVVTAHVDEAKSRAQERQRVTIAVGLGAVLLLVLGIAVVVRHIVVSLHGLTAAMRKTAEKSLPTVIAAMKKAPPDADPPAMPRYRRSTHDELRLLAEACTQVQDSAVRLAREQHQAQCEAAEMLINLGRRNQNLLSTLLTQFSELQRIKQDPDVLAHLSRLNHTATRIRRNAESMLIIAGTVQPRTVSAAVPIQEIIRAALSEIEGYTRVDLCHIEDEQVAGAVAADVVHLLAELIENATCFSPPQAQITVVGQRVRGGYRIRVLDRGMGMTRRELDKANECTLRAIQGHADSKLLGLHIVGRLAVRHGIRVTLEPSAAQGITATVIVPAEILAEYSPVSVLAGARSGGGISLRGPFPERVSALAGPAAPHHPVPSQGNTDAGPVAPCWQLAPGTAPAMPKRVRGAQLAGLDLGKQDLSVQFTPAPRGSRLDLRRFQRDIATARSLPADLAANGKGTDTPPKWTDHPGHKPSNEQEGDRP